MVNISDEKPDFKNKQTIDPEIQRRATEFVDAFNGETKEVQGAILRGILGHLPPNVVDAIVSTNDKDITQDANRIHLTPGLFQQLNNEETLPSTDITQNQPDKQDTGPEVDSREKKLKEIDASITRRAVHGIFSGQLQLHGEQLGEASDGFDTYGPPSDQRGRFKALWSMVGNSVSDYRDGKVSQYTKSAVVAYEKNEEDANLSHLCILYPHFSRDFRGRLTNSMSVQFTLPTNSLAELVAIIKDDPNALEAFYETAAADLDTNESVKKRWNLYKRILLIDADSYMPSEVFSKGQLQYHLDPQDARLNQSAIQELAVAK